MKQFLIILRGIPASGKSTIAKKIRNFDAKIAWLKVDNFKDFFGEGSQGQLDAANDAALATLKHLLDNSYSVVMEGVFQDADNISRAVEIGKDAFVTCKVFELQTSLDEAKKRDVDRVFKSAGARKAMKHEDFERINRTLLDTSYHGAIQVDTEQNNTEQCIKIILDSLND